MNVLVCNTKGGVGKSFVSTQILPLAFNNKQINIFELDNNNKTTLNSKVLNFKNLNVNSIDEILMDVAFADEVVNIIDAGGGDDTKAVLNALSENAVNVDYFIVPIVRDFEVIKNLKDTLNLIRNKFENPNIYVLLNKTNETEPLEQQFMYLFGSKEFEIDGIINELGDVTLIPVKNYNEIDIVKNIYKTTSLDVVLEGKEIVDNLKQYQSQWYNEAKKLKDSAEQKKYFAKKMAFYRLIKKMISIREAVQNAFSFETEGGENE